MLLGCSSGCLVKKSFEKQFIVKPIQLASWGVVTRYFMKCAVFGALVVAVCSSQPASAQVVCTPNPYVSGDLSCTNSGPIISAPGGTGINTQTIGNGNATTTNSGNVTAPGSGGIGILTSATGVGNATTTNSGALNVGTFGIQTLTSNGNASTTNSGNITLDPSFGETGIATIANGSGSTATTTNSGTISVNGPAAQGIQTIADGTATATNFGAVTGAGTFGIRTLSDNGDATTTNFGSVSSSFNLATGIFTTTNTTGNATTTNFGSVTLTMGGTGIATQANSGNATTSNSGSVNVSGGFACPVIRGEFAGCTISGSPSLTGLGGNVGIFTTTGVGAGTRPANALSIPLSDGNATTNNYGSVTVTGNESIPFVRSLSSQASIFFGSGANGIITQADVGNATTNNFGHINVTGFTSTGILTTANIGTATTVNAGIINVTGGVTTGVATVCGGICGSSVGIATAALSGNATVINSGIVNATGPNPVGVLLTSSGTSLLVNSGIINAPGGIAVQFTPSVTDPATLTLLPGSFIVGAINMIGPGDTVNVNAGNQNLTFNTLTGVNVNGNVPFVVSGNRIASIDPTGFAVTDRTLMDFTRAVSASLGGRASDAMASNDPAARALGFAAFDDSAARFEDPFAQAMGYAKAPNEAIVFKNPTMTTPDGTTVWAKGFYGQRTQQADGPILRNVSNFYGGLIGVDRSVRPDLRLGGLVGGGAINTAIDLNSGSTASDIVFAGVYGREDLGKAFVDFALLGGHTDNRTTRNVNNNLLASGLEIATASFDGWFISPEVAAGYRYDFAPGWSVTPTARLRYLAASYDGFTETGSTADLAAGGRTLQDVEERAEATVIRTLVGDAGRFQVGLTGGVLGQQRVGAGNVNAILLGQALAFATPGKSSIIGEYVGGSLDWRVRSNVAIFAAAEYTAMSDSSNTVTGMAGLRVGF